MKSAKGIVFKLQTICSVFVILTGITVIIATGGGGDGSGTPGTQDTGNTPGTGTEDKPFSLGQPVKMADAVIPPQGGTILIDDPDSPVNGLSIDILENAFQEDVPFSISYKPVQAHRLGNGISTLTPVISIENGGVFADRPVLLKIPAAIPAGHFAMSFYYDPVTGALEAMPLIYQDDEVLVTMAHHFCDVSTLIIPKENLQNLDIDTGFTLGRDDWHLMNTGSYLNPGGFCTGMSLSAIWYFMEEKPITHEPLWYQNMNTLGPGNETPHFWKDDHHAIRFCAMAQSNAGETTTEFVYDEVVRRYGISKHSEFNRLTFYSFAFAMAATKKPQMVGMLGTVKTSGEGATHAITCYKIKGRTLTVADPNFPGKPNVIEDEIVYDDKDGTSDGDFTNYISASSTLDFLAGNYIKYDRMRFRGYSSLDNLIVMRDLWLDFKSDLIGRCTAATAGMACFPDYRVIITKYKKDIEPPETASSHELDLISGTTAPDELVAFELDATFASKLSVYNYMDVKAYEAAAAAAETNGDPLPAQPSPCHVMNAGKAHVLLEEGNNVLGFYIRGEKEFNGATEYPWVGFHWVSIDYDPGNVTPVTPGNSDLVPSVKRAVLYDDQHTARIETEFEIENQGESLVRGFKLGLNYVDANGQKRSTEPVGYTSSLIEIAPGERFTVGPYQQRICSSDEWPGDCEWTDGGDIVLPLTGTIELEVLFPPPENEEPAVYGFDIDTQLPDLLITHVDGHFEQEWEETWQEVYQAINSKYQVFGTLSVMNQADTPSPPFWVTLDGYRVQAYTVDDVWEFHGTADSAWVLFPDGLGANEEKTVQWAGLIPYLPNWTDKPDISSAVVIDPRSEIVELDQTNNETDVTLHLKMPDLAAHAILFDPFPVDGGPVSGRAVIQNIGEAEARNASWDLLGAGQKVTGPNLSIPAGGEEIIPWSISGGWGTFVLRVDRPDDLGWGDVIELDEGNNKKYDELFPPDE